MSSIRLCYDLAILSRIDRRMFTAMIMLSALNVIGQSAARADGFDPFQSDAWSATPVFDSSNNGGNIGNSSNSSSDPFDEPGVNRLSIVRLPAANPPAEKPPATNPPATNPPATNPPIANPPAAVLQAANPLVRRPDAVSRATLKTPISQFTPVSPSSAATPQPNQLPTPAPVSHAAYSPYQIEAIPPPASLPAPSMAAAPAVPPPGCGIPNERPLNQLTINIQSSKGELPNNHASACWQQLNAESGPLAAARMWPVQTYNWEATCFASNPLYFEEVNLERYGYGCCTCLQSAYSAAHFFATVPALPYCMAVDCPGECKYTLGHYRPGSCPPWRFHRPPCSTLAGAAEAGVLTGFIFLIP